MGDDITTGELSRRLDEFRSDVRGEFANLHTRLDRLVSVDLYAAEQKAQDDKIAAFSIARRLAWSSFVAPVLVGLIVAVVGATG